MADVINTMREMLLQSVKAVNTAANQVADATRTKVDELNMRTRRKEILDSLAAIVYEKWQQGVEMPEDMTCLLEELHEINERLDAAERPGETPEASIPSSESEVTSAVTPEEDTDTAEHTPPEPS